MFAVVYINLIPCLRYTYCMKKINSQFLSGVLNMCYRNKLWLDYRVKWVFISCNGLNGPNQCNWYIQTEIAINTAETRGPDAPIDGLTRLLTSQDSNKHQSSSRTHAIRIIKMVLNILLVSFQCGNSIMVELMLKGWPRLPQANINMTGLRELCARLALLFGPNVACLMLCSFIILGYRDSAIYPVAKQYNRQPI